MTTVEILLPSLHKQNFNTNGKERTIDQIDSAIIEQRPALISCFDEIIIGYS